MAWSERRLFVRAAHPNILRYNLYTGCGIAWLCSMLANRVPSERLHFSTSRRLSSGDGPSRMEVGLRGLKTDGDEIRNAR